MFMALLEILRFDESAIWQYAQIRADLERQGELGAMDTMIAAHALCCSALYWLPKILERSRA